MSDSIYDELWMTGVRIPEIEDHRRVIQEFDPLMQPNHDSRGNYSDSLDHDSLFLHSAESDPQLPPPPVPHRSESLLSDACLVPAESEILPGSTFQAPNDDPFENEVSLFASPGVPIPKPRAIAKKSDENAGPDTGGSTSEQAVSFSSSDSRPGHHRSDSVDSFLSNLRRPPRDFDGESLDDLSDDGRLSDTKSDAHEPAPESGGSMEEKGSARGLPVVAPKPPPGKSKSGYLYVMDNLNDIAYGQLPRFIPRRQSCRRYLVLDEDKKILCIFSDEKSQVSKRVIPLDVIKNVKDITAPEDRLNKIELILSPPGFTGSSSDNNSRHLYLALKKQEVLMEWAQRIMKIIIDRDMKAADAVEESSIGHRLVASIVGGGADKQGWIKIDGVSKKRYFVIIGGLVAYYESVEDFALCLPLHYIDMKFASVKKHGGGGGKNVRSLELVTFARHYMLMFEHPEELDSWFTCFHQSIDEAISAGHNSDILKQIRTNRSNRFCADCGALDPDWGSLNFCILVCKWCSGLHRELGANPTSKVRGFKLDTRVWTPNTIRLMIDIGNENANKFWEAKLDGKSTEKAKPDWTLDERRQFIVRKYRVKSYADRHPLSGQPEELLKVLQDSVQQSSVFETMKLLYSFDKELVIEDTNLIELAKKSGETLQLEFLLHNDLHNSSQAIRRDKEVKRSCSRRAMRKGFLMLKSRHVDSDFSRRWCILAGGMGHFYLEENGTVAKESLDCAEDIVGIFLTEGSDNSKDVVSLYTKQRVFEISELDEQSDILTWLVDFSLSCSPDICAEKMPDKSELAAVGTVDVKRGSFASWSRHWLCITNNRRLLLFDEASDSHEVEEFDLRMISSAIRDEEGDTSENRAFSLKVTVFSKRNTLNADRGVSSTVLYLRAPSTQLTTLWRKRLEYASTKSGPDLQDQVLNRDSVPLIIAECMNYIIVNGEGVDGIYRISGVKSKVENLLEEFRKCPQSVHLSRNDWTIHEVTSTLKAFLRGLEDPPMTRELHQKWLEVGSYTEHEVKLQWYKYYLSKIPQVNYNVLKSLTMHLNSLLKAVSSSQSSTPGHKKQMDINGVASLFAPLLLSVYDDKGRDFADMSREIAIVKDLLTYHVWLFDIDEESFAKEEKMKEAEDKIKSLNQQGSQRRISSAYNLGEQKLKVDVFIEIPGRTDDMVVCLDITRGTSAQDALTHLKETGKITSLKSLSVFEVIIKDEVERNLFPNTLLHDVVMSWTHFGDSYCKSVHLRVKANYILERMELQYEPDVSMLSTVYYSGVSHDKKFKSFSRQHQLVLQNQTILLHKSKQSTSPLEEWNIQNTIFYHGIASRRKAPCQWGMTFICNPSKPGSESYSQDVFGYAVCFTSRQELYRWLASIYYAKYPEAETFRSFRTGAVRLPKNSS